MSGSQGTSTSTSSSSPWPAQQPFIKEVMSEAKDLYHSGGPKYYPGSTVAGFSADQRRGMYGINNIATKGNATANMGEKFTQDVLGGKYSGDPFGSQVYHNIENKVLPSVNSQFSASGRYGSGAHADTATRSLTDAFAPYASQQYQQGLDRMGQAANAGQQYLDNDYRAANAQMQVGGMRQQLAQAEIGDAKNRFDFQQDLPANKLGQYLQMIGGNWGNTSTSSTPYYKPSVFGQVAGAGLGLAGLLG